MIEEKITAFLEPLKERGIELTAEIAFICSDGAVLFIPNEQGGIDIAVVRNPIKVDYTLGITDKEVELWITTAEIVKEMEEI